MFIMYPAMNTPDPQKESKRIGTGMIAAGFVLALLLMTTFFDGFLNNARNPNSNPNTDKKFKKLQKFTKITKFGKIVRRHDVQKY